MKKEPEHEDLSCREARIQELGGGSLLALRAEHETKLGFQHRREKEEGLDDQVDQMRDVGLLCSGAE